MLTTNKERREFSREWLVASRAQREAYFAWQNASGDQVLPALDAYKAATKAQQAIEARLAASPLADFEKRRG